MSRQVNTAKWMLAWCVGGWVLAFVFLILAVYAFATKPSIGGSIAKARFKGAPKSERIAGLCSLGALKDSKSVPQLVELLKEEDTMIRMGAVTALIAIGKDAVPELVKVIETAQQLPIMPGEGTVVLNTPENAAAYALSGIGKEALPQLLTMLQSKEHKVWYTAAQIISRIGKDALPTLTKAFIEARDASLSSNIAHAIGLMGDVAEKALIETYNAVKEPFKRTQLLSQFGSLRNPSKEALELLFKAAEDPSTAPTALVALGQTRHHEAIRFLIEKLRSEDPIIRGNAAIALGIANAREAVPQLIELLKDEKTAASAANALGALRDTRAVKPLIELLQKKTPASMQAAYALGNLGAKEAVPALIATLKELKGSKDASFKIACIIALGQLRAYEAKPILQEMLNDPDQYVRENAKRILDQLSQ
ncbi:MAG: hypothetical protein HZRFUVUK_001109 [Candidatus Fervidibacterota bacterium]